MVIISKKKKKTYGNIMEIIKCHSDNSDFSDILIFDNLDLSIFYYKSLVNKERIQEFILTPIVNNRNKVKVIEDIKEVIFIKDVTVTADRDLITQSILKGSAVIYFKGEDSKGIIINSLAAEDGLRIQNDAENEYSVIGPKLGFIESLDTNMKLLRRSLNTPHLKFEEYVIGTTSNTRVAIAYLEGVTNPEHIHTARQRISDLDYDLICDSSLLDQLISDNSNTPFPLFLTTERVDRAGYCLINGQVSILCDGSPYVINAPTTIFDFFVSPEDYLLPWILGTFFRLIRILGVIFSLAATPVYVAILTYHIAIIPKDLLGPIIDSRFHVPFPPVLEALFLEIAMELLREAGARLPTKVGQTLGIVGGIVIGQAAVQAALTSTVLLILVALSALASFTTPTFKMSNTIRFLRFPLIILASIWGGFGLVAGMVMLYTHVLRLKSLGIPYFAPLYPFRLTEMSDGFVRLALPYINKRRQIFRPMKKVRFHVKETNRDTGDDFNNE